MSSSSRPGRGTIAQVIPERWQTFLASGDYAGTRASIRRDGSEVPVDFVARLEFLDERRLAIHVALAEDASERSVAGRAPSLVRLLTARERAVITLIGGGHETREIAETLHISPATVRTHVRNAMSKVGAHTRAQLVALVIAAEGSLLVRHADEKAADTPAA